MSVTFGDIVFDYVDYDVRYDTLRLFVGGPPRLADDWDTTEEGYGLDLARDADGNERIIGVDILSPGAILAQGGEVVLTLEDGTELRSPDVAAAVRSALAVGTPAERA